MKKKIKQLLFVIVIGMTFASCTKVPAGHVGIKFYLLGRDKGVDYEELSPGRYYIGINEELYLFPTFKQNKTWTNDRREDSPNPEGFEFQSKEGMKLTANVGIEYSVLPEHVSEVFEMYKKGLNEITDKVLRNATRDAFNMASSTRSAEQMYGPGKVDFMNEVEQIVKDKASERFVTVTDIYLIGNIGIPQSVTDALNRKIEATQRAEQRENELREAEAEAKKVIAQAQGQAKAIVLKAEAEAEANRKISASITPTLVKYEYVKRWDGVLSKVSGNAATIVDLK